MRRWPTLRRTWAMPARRGPRRWWTSFATWSKRCTARALRCILDVVFNHTAEGDETGPTISFRGLENMPTICSQPDQALLPRLYRHGQHGQRNHSIVRRLIRDCLRSLGTRATTSMAFALTWPRSCRATRMASRSADPPILWEHRIGSSAGGHQADRRGVGCRRALSAGRVHRRSLGRVERALSRRRAPLSADG